MILVRHTVLESAMIYVRYALLESANFLSTISTTHTIRICNDIELLWFKDLLLVLDYYGLSDKCQNLLTFEYGSY